MTKAKQNGVQVVVVLHGAHFHRTPLNSEVFRVEPEEKESGKGKRGNSQNVAGSEKRGGLVLRRTTLG